MKKYVLSSFAGALVVAAGMVFAPAYAYHCPLLVKECRALVGKLEQRAGTDEKRLARARAGCEEAQKLHEAGKHKASVVKAGEAIALAGKAAK